MSTAIVSGVTSVVSMGWLVTKVCEEAGTRVLEQSIRSIMQRRAETARDIALEEVRAGRGNIVLDAPAADEAVAVLWRYLRAAEEGTARLNLRLMASILGGKQEAPPIFASEFLRWADLIASLSEAEVHFLSVLHRECLSGNRASADQRARGNLIPEHFGSADEYVITGYALMRTGLVRQSATLMMSDGEGLEAYFVTTHRMERLAQLSDFEGAIERET